MWNCQDDAYDHECCCCLSDKDCIFKGNKEETKLGEQTVNVDEAVHLHEIPKIHKSVDQLSKLKNYEEKTNNGKGKVNGRNTEETKK